MTTNTAYPAWQQTYSFEDVDRTQALATKLTQADRDAGLEAPKCGASGVRLDEAKAIVRGAQY